VLQLKILWAYNKTHTSKSIGGSEMLGIIITLLAVLAVICFAFHYSELPSSRGSKADALHRTRPGYGKKDSGDADSQDQEESEPILNR
jgi:hypothetical protein